MNLRAASNAKGRVGSMRLSPGERRGDIVQNQAHDIDRAQGIYRRTRGRRRRRSRRSLSFSRLLFIFRADFAARHQTERADILADAIFVDRYLFGLEIGDELAVRVAHDDIQQYFAGRASDYDIRRLGRLG